MTNPKLRDDELDEAPLDPAAQRLQVKLRRLLLGSSLIMFLGFVAVFAAIIYKINEPSDDEGVIFAETIVLPEPLDIRSVNLSDGVLTLVGGQGGATVLVFVDAQSGEVLGTSRVLSR
ncbi:DUF6476 family protein [Roseibium aquae]|nr:DUF6476 family protein [Roseibium aquae]